LREGAFFGLLARHDDDRIMRFDEEAGALLDGSVRGDWRRSSSP
jgi:hypothetical protein